jgi:hypothetical protein
MVHPRQLAASALLQGEGYPAESAAAWVGTFSQESGVSLPSAFRRGKLDHGSQALPQWRDSKEDPRLTKYMDYVKGLHPGATEDELWVWYGNMALQLKYVAIEADKSFHALDVELRRGGDIDVLSDAICWHFEMPNRALSGIANRKRQARLVFDAAPHIHTSGHTNANVDVSKATKAVKNSQAKLGGGTVAAAVVAGLHFAAGMPPGVMVAILAITAVVVIHSFAAAKAAVAKIPGATLTAGKTVSTPAAPESGMVVTSAGIAVPQWPPMTGVPALPPPAAPTHLSTLDIEAVANAVVAHLHASLPAPQQETKS